MDAMWKLFFDIIHEVYMKDYYTTSLSAQFMCSFLVFRPPRTFLPIVRISSKYCRESRPERLEFLSPTIPQRHRMSHTLLIIVSKEETSLANLVGLCACCMGAVDS